MSMPASSADWSTLAPFGTSSVRSSIWILTRSLIVAPRVRSGAGAPRRFGCASLRVASFPRLRSPASAFTLAGDVVRLAEGRDDVRDQRPVDLLRDRLQD